jgi:hypothetical protein
MSNHQRFKASTKCYSFFLSTGFGIIKSKSYELLALIILTDGSINDVSAEHSTSLVSIGI